MKLMKQFREFVASKHPRTKINNFDKSGIPGWKQCAVGKFAESMNMFHGEVVIALRSEEYDAGKIGNGVMSILNDIDIAPRSYGKCLSIIDKMYPNLK